LPASGWEMTANVRRPATGSADRAGFSIMFMKTIRYSARS
jgi:hypothetical protein